MDIDSSYGSFLEIKDSVEKNVHKITSEEDAKIQIIIRILTEVLGWTHSDIEAERKHQNGFSDFIISINKSNAFVLEAKKIGRLDIKTEQKDSLRELKLSGPNLKNIEGPVDQVTAYALASGIPIAVISDGLSWIVLKSFVPGTHYKEKEAFVFPSLQAIAKHFSCFYELLSKEHYTKKTFNVYFDRLHNNRTILTSPLVPAINEFDIKTVQKSAIAFDLSQVFARFFSRLTGDKDEDLLIECFVETRESRIADFSLEKITNNVLGNITPASKDLDIELKSLVEKTVETEDGESIFIVGPTGAGKTTFLERFFSKTLSKTVRKECFVLNINCLDSTGNEDSAFKWLTDALINQLEKLMFHDGMPTWEQLRGFYFREYERRRIGVDEKLYNSDKNAFQKKFGEFLEKQIEIDREGYLKRLLADCVNNRKKLPIILVDNTDEFSPKFKESIFQYTQSLRRHIKNCLLIFPITDKSAWAFSKTDIYSIYSSKSFFLPTPPPREIFRKRIEYIRGKLGGLKSDSEKKDYLSKKGIKITIQNLQKFATIIEEVFVDNENTSKTIGELTNYNIRSTLELSQRVITSPVYKISDLLSTYASGELAVTNYKKFINALLRGDYELYKLNDNTFIYPIYKASDQIPHSPLLSLRVLTLLKETKNSSRSIEDRHISLKSLYSYFDTLSCNETALDQAIRDLLESKLIETFDISSNDLFPDQKIAISYSGERHLQLATHNNVFFENMALITPISNHDVASQIANTYNSNEGYKEKMLKIRTLFSNFLIEEDRHFIKIPETGEQYECQKNIDLNIQKFSGQNLSETDDETERKVLLEGVIATVDFYNFSKGFGFLDVPHENRQAHISQTTLKNFDIGPIFDGDKLLCDINQNEKGIYVSKIHDIENKLDNAEEWDAEVVRLFVERNYGFVQNVDGDKSAYFHFSILDPEHLKYIQVGEKSKVQVSNDKTGKNFQVRKFISNTHSV